MIAPSETSPAAAGASLSEALDAIRRMSPAERSRFEEDLSGVPELRLWSPSSGPQAAAYDSPADELFYGGAAGGGKTALIVGLALTRHRRTLILRRESTQLRGLLDDMATTLGTRDGLNTQSGQWRIPPRCSPYPGEHLVEFGGVPNPGDEEKHQGIAHDLLAFDEVTQLPEYVVNYLTTWNRSTGQGQRCRIVMTSNPPTPSTQRGAKGASSGGGLWLIRRYAPWLDNRYKDPCKLGKAASGELRWFVTLGGVDLEWPDPFPFIHTTGERQEEIRPRSRTFIPSRVADNPYLASTDYESTLQKLPEPLRSALLYGDFSVSLSDRPMQLFPTEWVRQAMDRWEIMSRANPPPTSAPNRMTALGCDIARGGRDNMVIAPRYGTFFDRLKVIPGSAVPDGPAAASYIVQARRDDAIAVIDAINVGASAIDHLRAHTRLDEFVRAYVGSEAATKRDRSGMYGFLNFRTQSYWNLREMLDPASRYEIALPPDEALAHEMGAHTYEEVTGGRLKVIPKEQVAVGLGGSPDRIDAVVMAATVHDDYTPQHRSFEEARSNRLEEALRQQYEEKGERSPRFDPRNLSWSDPLPYPRRY